MPGLDGRPAAASRPIGLRADAQRDEAHVAAVDAHRRGARHRCASVGVELERRLRRRRRPRSSSRRSRATVDGAPASNTSHSPFARQRDRHELQVEAAGDRPRQHRQIASRLSVITSTSRLRSNRRASSSRRPTASSVRARAMRRQVAGDEADREEREQRDPVLRLGNRERADRRQEEEVEGEHRHDRRGDGHPQARGRRDHEHDHQEGRRDGRRVGQTEPPRARQRHDREGGERCGEVPRLASGRTAVIAHDTGERHRLGSTHVLGRRAFDDGDAQESGEITPKTLARSVPGDPGYWGESRLSDEGRGLREVQLHRRPARTDVGRTHLAAGRDQRQHHPVVRWACQSPARFRPHRRRRPARSEPPATSPPA